MYYADLTEDERAAMRKIAALEDVPVGVLVGRAVRTMYGGEIAKLRRHKQKSPSFFSSTSLKIDQKDQE